MMPSHRKRITLILILLLVEIIALLTQSIIATNHNAHSSPSASQFDEEEIVEVGQPSEHQRSALESNNHLSNLPIKQEELSPSTSSGQNNKAEKSKLLFAWKRLPTNKCSRTCGKGHRIYHLSCIDLKYNVRVEERFCSEEANLPKADESSEEPCNEFDCPPEWSSVEYQECSNQPEAGESGRQQEDHQCHLNVYKRIQCTMLDRSGKSIQLPDSSCNSTAEVSKDANFEPDRELELSLESSSGGGNDIIPGPINADYSPSSPHGPAARASANEPFYDLGAWSECSGASCGQLGKRIRMVSCRLHLIKSSRFIELPVSSCQHLPAPDVQEPCYLDCTPPPSSKLEPDEAPVGRNISDSKHTQAESSLVQTSEDNEDDEEFNSLEETIYDPEMVRYSWKTAGFTKCSAECLGGRRESIIECWDTIANSVVEDHSLCGLHQPRPKPAVESCNEVPCQPEWRVDRFSRCSRSCGSAGLKSRSVLCVQQVPLLEGGSNLVVVDKELCLQSAAAGPMPETTEPCNRVDCRPEWSVSPWSECSKECGDGLRNRTVICVQEFATREGPTSTRLQSHRWPQQLSADMLEAFELGRGDWHPGKAIQVPSNECYQEYRTVPVVEEKCFNFCENQAYVDSEPNQNYRLAWDNIKKKTVSLKIGGKATLVEGKNVKIRCRILNRESNDNLVRKHPQHIVWLKDNINIFHNGSNMAEKLYVPDENTSIGNDISNDDKNNYLADDPNSSAFKSQPRSSNKPRTLMVRSSNLLDAVGNYTFVPKIGGRFSLLKENTLRIRRLLPEDSGLYRCSYKSLSETLELKVLSRREFFES